MTPALTLKALHALAVFLATNGVDPAKFCALPHHGDMAVVVLNGDDQKPILSEAITCEEYGEIFATLPKDAQTALIKWPSQQVRSYGRKP